MTSAPDPVTYGRAHRLALATRPRRGTAGQQFGRGTGSSLEFQELRDYQAGDDLRHVDWRSYARSEQLHSRLYRDEVAPVAELIVDGSRSMQLTPAKAAATRWLVRFLAALLAPDMHLRPVLASDPPVPLPAAALADPSLPGIAFDGARSLGDLPLTALLRPGSVRVVVSDFLFPHDPSALVDSLGRGASSLLLLAVLDGDELDPPRRGQLRLTEVETGATRDLPVDDRTVARYRQRLARLWDGLALAARRRAGLALRWDAATPAPAFVADELLAHGVVTPR